MNLREMLLDDEHMVRFLQICLGSPRSQNKHLLDVCVSCVYVNRVTIPIEIPNQPIPLCLATKNGKYVCILW